MAAVMGWQVQDWVVRVANDLDWLALAGKADSTKSQSGPDSSGAPGAAQVRSRAVRTWKAAAACMVVWVAGCGGGSEPATPDDVTAVQTDYTTEPGQDLTIRGTGLEFVQTVRIGRYDAKIVDRTGLKIVVTVPADTACASIQLIHQRSPRPVVQAGAIKRGCEFRTEVLEFAQLINQRPGDPRLRLVPGRLTRVGVNVLYKGSPEIPPPSASLYVYNGTQLMGRLDMAPLPTAAAEPPNLATYTVMRQSYQVNLPPQWVGPGLRIDAAVDEAKRYGTALNLTAQPTVGLPTSMDIVVVPMMMASEESPVDDQALAQIVNELRSRMPVAQDNIHVRRRSPHIITSQDLFSALGQLGRLKALENSTSHYHGVLSRKTSELDRLAIGMAYLDERLSVAVGPYYDSRWLSTMVHEFGHSYGLEHAPCGNPGFPDTAYPYPDAGLGPSPMFDIVEGKLYPPEGSDVMSYCRGRWFSDYNVQKLQGRLEALSASPPPVPVAPQAAKVMDVPMLLVSGRIENDEVLFEPLQLASGLSPTPPMPFGGTRDVAVLRVRGTSGPPIELTFQPLVVDHDDARVFFHLVVPAPENIASIEVLRHGAALTERLANGGKRLLPMGVTTFSASGPEEPLSANVRQTGARLEVSWAAGPSVSVSVAHLDATGQRTVMALEAVDAPLSLSLSGLPARGAFEVSLVRGKEVRLQRVEQQPK